MLSPHAAGADQHGGDESGDGDNPSDIRLFGTLLLHGRHNGHKLLGAYIECADSSGSRNPLWAESNYRGCDVRSIECKVLMKNLGLIVD